jgi:uncharacterized membrane protein YeaQ/YmgE (transglycosylase-associated protein family)
MRDVYSWIYVIGIGLIAGVIASIVIPMDMGIAGAIVVGIIGAVIGFYLFPTLLGANASPNPTIAAIITSAAGAIILLTVLRLISAG